MGIVMTYRKFKHRMTQNYPVLYDNQDSLDKVHKHVIRINYVFLHSIGDNMIRNRVIRTLACEYLRYNELETAWWSL